jgi:hypothetical protein
VRPIRALQHDPRQLLRALTPTRLEQSDLFGREARIPLAIASFSQREVDTGYDGARVAHGRGGNADDAATCFSEFLVSADVEVPLPRSVRCWSHSYSMITLKSS